MDKGFTIIGDVHGKVNPYLEIVNSCDYSLQIGDLGDYNTYAELNRQYLDSLKHRYFRGNHDDTMYSANGHLGPYGKETLNGVDFFFISGAFSIDRKYRTSGLDWWPNEELSYAQMQFALDAYKAYKPSLMFSHDCPGLVSRKVGNPDILRSFGFDPHTFTNNTQELLSACFSFYQPKVWVFGHYHVPFDKVINGTRFICLPTLGTIHTKTLDFS